jgi:hypothetical protein
MWISRNANSEIRIIVGIAIAMRRTTSASITAIPSRARRYLRRTRAMTALMFRRSPGVSSGDGGAAMRCREPLRSRQRATPP